jgi:coenzyme F420-dependent glucose-6-phosphate dehydrogenase
LITASTDRATMRGVIDAFRRGGGTGKPVFLQVKLAWASTEQEALAAALDQWGANVFASPVASDLSTPAHFDALRKHVTETQIRQSVRISSDLDQHIAWLREDRELGVESLYLHNVGRNQRDFIDAFGRAVLPAVRK